MVKVVERGRYSVYVYDERGERHHRPHCHVRWRDGEASVDLETFDLLVGDALSAVAVRMVRDHAAEINAAWERLNPRRTTG